MMTELEISRLSAPFLAMCEENAITYYQMYGRSAEALLKKEVELAETRRAVTSARATIAALEASLPDQNAKARAESIARLFRLTELRTDLENKLWAQDAELCILKESFA